MDTMALIRQRHSVRNYKNIEIKETTLKELNSLIASINDTSGLNIRLICNESNTFDNFLGRYGKFINVNNYIVISGKKSSDTEEKAGYYGEKIVLKATELGLGTCWVGASYSKKNIQLPKNEKIICVIAIGYAEKEGVPHKSKQFEQVVETRVTPPDWFRAGIEAALLAPTALNQQKFKFILTNSYVEAQISGFSLFTKVDLGIVKYHFEIVAGKENFTWKS